MRQTHYRCRATSKPPAKADPFRGISDLPGPVPTGLDNEIKAPKKFFGAFILYYSVATFVIVKGNVGGAILIDPKSEPI